MQLQSPCIMINDDNSTQAENPFRTTKLSIQQTEKTGLIHEVVYLKYTSHNAQWPTEKVYSTIWTFHSNYIYCSHTQNTGSLL
jgi:hypothetical protein